MGKKSVRQKWAEALNVLEADDQADKHVLSFREFVNKVYPRYQWYRHCQVLADVLQRVADGKLKRVMVFLPPRHGKSLLVSKLFPGYLLYRHGDKWVGLNSYAAELSYTFSRAARDAYRDIGGKMRDDAAAVKNWETPDGGGCWASGVGGPITGKGFGSCLTKNVIVSTDRGDIPISKLFNVGDLTLLVKSYSHNSQRLEYRKVKAYSKTCATTLIKIELEGGCDLVCTLEHPIYTDSKGYVPASNISSDDILTKLDELQGTRQVKVRKVSFIFGDEDVYNLSVEGNENYFANGILTHNCGIIDDPLKNAKEALSTVIKRGHQDWYGSTFYTRAEPDAPIMLVATRWAQDDLPGWLLEQESEDEPERWHIVNFEAIKEDAPPRFPSTCTVEPDWRREGEALCPERFDLGKLSRIKKRLGTYFFGALYQQRPSPIEGDHFKRSWWQFYKIPPVGFDEIIQSWDCAFKETNSSDFVVGQVWGRKGADFYLLDQVRDRMDINGTMTAIRSLSAKHPKSTAKLVEDKANGSAVIDLLKREIAGLIPIEPEGGKLVRAVAIAPYIQAGNVWLPDPTIAPWIHDYIEEFAVFPNGAFDDMCDSTSQALNWMQSHQNIWHEQLAAWG